MGHLIIINIIINLKKKNMKKIFMVAIVATSLGMGLISCNKDEDQAPVEKGQTEKTLNVITEIGTKAVSFGPLSLFRDGDQIGLFATKGSLGNNYNDFAGYANVNSTRKGGVWVQDPNVYLTGESCKLFAYFPYKKNLTDGTSIDIESTSQTDYMFGTHTNSETAVNSDNPDVYITMKHALALVQFNISKKNYNAVGKLTKITIKGNAGFLFKSAKMNCQTGTVTVKDEADQATGIFIQNMVEGLIPSVGTEINMDESTFPKVLNLPVNSTLRDGDLTAIFTIDGKDYPFKFSAGTQWESSKKYTYTITLNGTEINIGGGDGEGGGDGSVEGNGDVDIDDWGTGGANGSGNLS